MVEFHILVHVAGEWPGLNKQASEQTFPSLQPVQYPEREGLKSHRLSCLFVSAWVLAANQDAVFT